MQAYLIRRLLLLPLTLFAIILVNFLILNLVPGDPVTVIERSQSGDATKNSQSQTSSEEHQHLVFREHYGLTLPILFNYWWLTPEKNIYDSIDELVTKRKKGSQNPLTIQQFHKLKTHMGDKARFVMPQLLALCQNTQLPLAHRKMAHNLLLRGGLQQGFVGPTLTPKQKALNRQITLSNAKLSSLKAIDSDSDQQLLQKSLDFSQWLVHESPKYVFSNKQKLSIFFFQTRFARYLSKVVKLDFGTLRNDTNKTVIHEVAKRLKYSLTLAVIPMLLTFALCQFFGMIMAINHNRPLDFSLNVVFLILFSIPIFVVAPFLIEKVALHRTLPFTSIPIPICGFHSQEHLYENMISTQRLCDICTHLILPLIAVMYGTLAVQSRLSRTAFLEVLKQDYVRTAYAKGLPLKTILIKHVGRNGAVTIVTSLASSLGVVLGGSLIVETVFEINGFGRFFYEAILNRDYNVVLFSAFAGSGLTLLGYLLADIAYTLLDPRINLE
jgi:peptide/nickel transport system permease protein